jgi:hypothetical protein
VPADRAWAIDVIPQYGLQRGYLDLANGAAQKLTRAAIAENAIGEKLASLIFDHQARFEMIRVRQYSSTSV